MSLSVFCKKVIRAGLANRVAANELIAAVDGFPAGAVQGTAVAALGALASAGTAIGALATVHAPLGAPVAVGTGAVDVACALAADVDARLTDIHTAFDAQIVTINARVTTLQSNVDADLVGVDARVATLQAKIDALSSSLRVAGLIDT